jgi:hypothetical protein
MDLIFSNSDDLTQEFKDYYLFIENDYIHGELDKDINEAIAEIEEAMKPKMCDGCKHLDGVICKHDRGLYCVRQFEADYFVKDNE